MTGVTNSLNPFPGLRPFRPDEDYLFFGREEQTMELLQRLGENRFVAVVGTSGSGKSSLVRCGLLSELQGGTLLRAGASWEIAVTHPGGDPLSLLADALLDADLYDREEVNQRERLLATLTRSHFGLVEAVRQANLGHQTNFLLVVDQFEEIFRFHEAGQTQQEAANEFISHLLQAVAQQEVPIYVVITMRSDFIGECSQFEGLSEMVNRAEFLIPKLTREQYKRVVESPIKVAGGEITPRLLQRLLNDLRQQADQLPCLQHALMRTWMVAREKNTSQAVDLDDYQQVGKMSQALSLHADEVYESLESDRQRQICEGIFKALTVRESENRGVRRPQRLASLSQILDVPSSELMPVMDAYRQHGVSFLTPPTEVEVDENTIIDISHESLMRVWTRLRRWAEEESQAAGIYRRLSESAAMYQQGEAGLYRDPELSIALSWRETHNPNQAWAARYHLDFDQAIQYLDRSQTAAQEEEREREQSRQRELEQARTLAETQRLRADEQRRSAIRLRWLVAGLAGIAAMAFVAFVTAARASKRAAENEAHAVAAHAEAVEAADVAEQALGDAQLARDAAERASDAERNQRQVAETQTATAVKAQKQLEIALTEAERARQEAEQAKLRAESSRQQAEDERERAKQAEQRAIEDHRIAEREKRLAEKNAELARRREQLFEKLLPLLQEHAAEGVQQYAQKLQQDGKPREALDTFADFTNLVLGEQQAGFLASELLNLNSFELQGLDTDVVATEISVPPQALFRHVLSPAIELGEQQLARAPDQQLTRLLATLHSYRARLLKQHPQQDWDLSESVATVIFHSFDRAAALEPDRYEHFLERAGARFRLPDPDLLHTLEDLDKAIELYPSPPVPVVDASDLTDRHRHLAQIQHARGNVLEYLAIKDPTAAPAQLLADAERSHRDAMALDPQNPNYAVGVARTLRRRHDPATAAEPTTDLLASAEQLLTKTLAVDARCPEAHNELGEVLILRGRIAESRQAFEKAVIHGKQAGRKRGLYVFYCNLANAYSRDPTDQAGYRNALRAAEQAIALQAGNAVEGQYYRGFALWKQGRTREALEALSLVQERAPDHVDTLLAKCQIVFEMKEPAPATSTQLRTAYADIGKVLAMPDLSTDKYAKACYVNSLGWLRHHLQQRTEQALVNCQEFALKAAQRSPSYVAFAKQIFEHAATLNWQDAELRRQSELMREQFESL